MEKGENPELLDRDRLEKILQAAMKQGASDVHFKAGERILVRVNGKLHGLNMPRLTPRATEGLFESIRPPHLKDLTPDTLKEVDFSFAVEGAGRFRVNAFRQRGSVALVVRVIPIRIPTFSELRLPEALVGISETMKGLILVTGTTKSGKSTTLAAIIDHINRTRTAHIITIEDPIEFLFMNDHSSVVQRELGTDTAAYASALRAALRQDPDVIMLGEMRDTETIDIALRAAETGHLVLSAAHSTDVVHAIRRLISVFPAEEQPIIRYRLSESLRAIVSQRLVPRADGAGLVAAAEIMINNEAIQGLIRDPEKTPEVTELLAKGKKSGMQNFDQSLMRLLKEKQITRDAAMAAATNPAELDVLLRLGEDEDEELELEYHSYSVMEGGDGNRPDASAAAQTSGNTTEPAQRSQKKDPAPASGNGAPNPAS